MSTTTISYTMPSVADLVRRIGEGDSAAWEEIVHRYGKHVSATVRSFQLQDADTLDAVQTTWLRLAENAHRVQHPERLGGWLATTARRECLHILRHRAKLTSAPVDVVTEIMSDPSAGPEQRVINADTARTLWKLVDELSPCRKALLRALFTDSHRPYAEVAHVTGILPSAIGPTRARALRQLRGKLEEKDPPGAHRQPDGSLPKRKRRRPQRSLQS